LGFGSLAAPDIGLYASLSSYTTNGLNKGWLDAG
jgi:hypothetical protein